MERGSLKRWGVTAVAIMGLALLGGATIATVAADLAASHQHYELARRLRPDEGSYFREEAEVSVGTEEDRVSDLRAALVRNPFDAAAWGALATADFESSGIAAAESDVQSGLSNANSTPLRYLMANLERIDGNLAASRSTLQSALAGLLFSASNPAPARQEFDSALTEFLSASPADAEAVVRPLVRLPRVQRAAGVAYLDRNGLPGEAYEVWRTVRCAEFSTDDRMALLPDSLPSIASALGARLLDAGGASGSPVVVDEAQQVWNRAVESCGLLQAPVLPGAAITDPAFSHAWAGEGFSWRDLHQMYLELVPGPTAHENAVHLSLVGNPSSDLAAFAQWVPVVPGTMYTASCDARGDEPGEGFALEILVNREVAFSLPLGLKADWVTSRGEWRDPAGASLAEVRLAYHRQPGETVYQGNVWIAEPSLTTLQTPERP